MDSKEILQYQTATGRVPFREWLLSLKDEVARARIRVQIDRLKLGNTGDTKPIGEGVLELRLHFGPGFRIYFGQDGAKFIILLCGGDKSDQHRDIKRAQEYWEDYKRRDER